MKKILFVFGTRPEAIKMAPLIKVFDEYQNIFQVKICVTAQHRQMLDQVLTFFEIIPDYDFNLMTEGQTLERLTSDIILKMNDVFNSFNPDIVLVHGDTTTTLSVSLAAFYRKIKIGHVEAGLRTGNIYSPWPEEANRKICDILSNYHFVPTEVCKTNLLKENISDKTVFITGNTVIDALFLTLNKIHSNVSLENEIINRVLKFGFNPNNKFVLITCHRRENFGKSFIDICEAIAHLAKQNSKISFVYPVHLNPEVNIPTYKILSKINNVYLLDPFVYEDFVYLMDKSYIIITDSGGIQEEAPSLGKPVLVLRETTERPEALESGVVKLVGTNKETIISNVQELLNNKKSYGIMSNSKNPYGDGKASYKIVDELRKIID
jgi:UDP-N-acetylglucosamine 2-epimerase (non-hydrolysing)